MLTPILISIRCEGSRPSFQVSRRSSSLRAARTARTASSSCAVGTPKTAMTASPTYFSIVPPSASISSAIAAK